MVCKPCGKFALLLFLLFPNFFSKNNNNTLQKQSLKKASFQGPTMPWIDPKKEGEAEMIAVGAGFKSRSQVIRERGGNPQDVFEQIKQERKQEKEADIVFSTTQSKPTDKSTNEDKNDQETDDTDPKATKK